MGKPKPVVDEEASEKNTIKNSPLGKWMMSDRKCPHCQTPALPSWKTECVKCGKGLDEKPVEEPPKEQPKAKPTSAKKGVPSKKPVAKAEEPAEEEPAEADAETTDEETATEYECKKCGTPVSVDDEKCPKCGCTEAVAVE